MDRRKFLQTSGLGLAAASLTRIPGFAATPEDITSSLQDALFDCDWLPMEVFTGDTCTIEGKEIKLHRERYQVLIVPPVEVIPHETLARVKAFFDVGGIVVGGGSLPTKSATIGKTAADIAALRTAIWGDARLPGTKPCQISSAGGRSYLLSEKATPAEIADTLTGDAGLHPTLEVLAGETNDWLHVLHRSTRNKCSYIYRARRRLSSAWKPGLGQPGHSGWYSAG